MYCLLLLANGTVCYYLYKKTYLFKKTAKWAKSIIVLFHMGFDFLHEATLTPLPSAKGRMTTIIVVVEIRKSVM